MDDQRPPAIFTIVTSDDVFSRRFIDWVQQTHIRPNSTVLRMYNSDPEETIISLRQSLEQAQELIDAFASAGVEHDARHYQVMQVPWAVLDAARKWLEEHK